MRIARNSRLAAIRRRLRDEYDLDELELRLLTADLVLNLDVLCNDIEKGAKAGEWDQLQDAADALSNLGRNIGQDDLVALAKTLKSEVADEAADTVVRLAKRLAEINREFEFKGRHVKTQ